MKLKGFCTAKDTIILMKRQPAKWETFLTSSISDRIFIIWFIKGTQKSRHKENNLIKNGDMEPKRFLKRRNINS